MPAATPAAPEPLEGLTLEQYAGITAALAEGHPLPAILANEGLPPDAWPAADIAWKARLAEDGVEGPVFAQFRDKRAVAEDWLARKVDPIDSDLGAWMSFLRAFSEHEAPFDLLTGAGLGMNDIARLGRRWGQRLAEDAALQKQAAEIGKKGPGPLPAMKAQPGELKPFPWSKGATAKKAAAPAPAAAAGPMGGLSVLDLSFYRYVAAKAHLAEHPGDEEHVRVKMALPDFAKIDIAWQARLEGDPVLARDYRQLLDHERGKIRNAAKRAASAPVIREAAAPPVEAPPASRNPLAGTALAVDVPRGPALPFTAEAPPASTAAASVEAPPGSRNPLGGTALAVDVPRGPALPFAADATPSRSPLGGTALTVDVPRGPALPFAADATPASSATPAAAAAPAVESPSPSRNPLSGTALAVDVPRGPALPFAGDAAMPRVEKKANRLGELAMGLQIPEHLRIPTEPQPAPAPELTLEQHASLCCELSEAPEQSAETLARYRLTAAQKEQLDRQFAERFAREAGLREAWDRAHAAYRAWRLAQRRDGA